MIVISGKKVLSVLGIIVMCVFTFAITNFNIKNATIKDNETIATVALPVNERVIIIDAGHGVPDEGAESSTRNNRSRK